MSVPFVVTFFVEGMPAPGGSKQVFPMWKKGPGGIGWELLMKDTPPGARPWPLFRVVDDAGQSNKEWKAAVAARARLYMLDGKPFEGAMKVEFIFFLRRPLKHFRTGAFSDVLRTDAPIHHLQRPDALKFARSTEDALTGILWADDCTNIRICSEKRWCSPGEKTGCAIKAIPLNIEETLL